MGLFASTLASSADDPPREPATNPYGVAPIDFSDIATQVQRVPLGNYSKLIIECFCPGKVIKSFGSRDEVTLRITGRFSISGYHGSREDAGAEPIKPGELYFLRQEKDGVLRLVSREFRYIHHRLVLTRIEVRAPKGVEVQFVDIAESNLDGRRLE